MSNLPANILERTIQSEVENFVGSMHPMTMEGSFQLDFKRTVNQNIAPGMGIVIYSVDFVNRNNSSDRREAGEAFIGLYKEEYTFSLFDIDNNLVLHCRQRYKNLL